MVDERLSEAIIVFLGKGRSAFPRSDSEAVRAAFPGAGIEGLLDEITAIAAEFMAAGIDGDANSLSRAGDEARRIMAARHPELSDDALTALRWMFTYNLR